MKNALGRIDTKLLTERASLAAETQLIDDGTGDVMIYKVAKSNLVKVPNRHAQCLFSDESYVIHYTLMVRVYLVIVKHKHLYSIVVLNPRVTYYRSL